MGLYRDLENSEFLSSEEFWAPLYASLGTWKNFESFYLGLYRDLKEFRVPSKSLLRLSQTLPLYIGSGTWKKSELSHLWTWNMFLLPGLGREFPSPRPIILFTSLPPPRSAQQRKRCLDRTGYLWFIIGMIHILLPKQCQCSDTPTLVGPMVSEFERTSNGLKLTLFQKYNKALLYRLETLGGLQIIPTSSFFNETF